MVLFRDGRSNFTLRAAGDGAKDGKSKTRGPAETLRAAGDGAKDGKSKTRGPAETLRAAGGGAKV